MSDILREPYAESANLYPGLCVHDGRVTGSITAGQTRLPVWAFIHDVVNSGVAAADETWEFTDHGLTQEGLCTFLHSLVEQRGEFGRLVLLLADVERREATRRLEFTPWWERKTQRARVLAQLKRCMKVLEP